MNNENDTMTTQTTHVNWSTTDIPDLTGKTIVVTGANSGIGFHAAKEFARKGAETILSCRSLERGQRAVEAIKAEIPNANAQLMELDLANLQSIKRFADSLNQSHSHIHVLLNNAGILGTPYSHTQDGFESQVGTNHLGHFALTGRLLPLILETPAARVVTVSSVGHRNGKIDFDNLLYQNGGYSPYQAYYRSKLANLLFTYELQRRLDNKGVDAMALAAHPGLSSTNIANHIWYFRLLSPILNLLSQRADKGAMPLLRASVDPHAKGGQYYGPSGRGEWRGAPVLVSSTPESHDAETARKLWEASQELTGIEYSQLQP